MPSLPNAHAPAHELLVRVWVLDRLDQLSSLRASLTEATSRPNGGLPATAARIVAAMVLVGSELATNALLHAAPPTTVSLRRTHSTFLIDVCDSEPFSVPAIAQPRGPGEGGFGLILAAQLSQQIGWHSDGLTKHIWVTFSAKNHPGLLGAHAEADSTGT